MRRYSLTLFPAPDTGYSTLVLRPLLISDLVTPVVGGDGGVNAQMVSRPSGLLVSVDPWQSMSIGDHVAVYWDDIKAAERLIGRPEEVNERVLFFIPKDLVVPEWAEKVFYRVTRQGSTTSEDSTPLRIRVKLDLPAGTDREPHLPGHSELLSPVLPQEVIDNGVDEKWAAAGVPVQIAAYPGRAAQDTIRLEWGAAEISRIVTPAEVADTAPITIDIDQATILAGGDDPQLRVIYEVFDEVWNFATDWSRYTTVSVEAGAQQLREPFIAEAENSIIDLGQLGTRDVTVEINLGGPPFALRDSVTMTWAGTSATGSPVNYTQTFILDNIPTILEAHVPNATVRAILGGRAIASYVLSKADGSAPQSSKRAIARITGQIRLPAATVFEAVGDTLDPNLERAHVQIPVYPLMADGDLINVIWLGTLQNGTPYLYEAERIVSANEVGTVVHVQVAAEHILPLANGELDLSYRVSNDNLAALDVRVSDHKIFNVAQRGAQLPAPSVDEAAGGLLDPARVPVQATLQVAYTGTVVNDILTWYWQGDSLNGSASDWVPTTTLTAGKPVTFYVPRAVIEPNIGKTVKVYYSLKLANTGLYQYSRVLELTIGTPLGT